MRIFTEITLDVLHFRGAITAHLLASAIHRIHSVLFVANTTIEFFRHSNEIHFITDTARANVGKARTVNTKILTA
jgi:hypothetical protein